MAVIEQEQRNRIPILEQTQMIEQIVEKIKDFEQLKGYDILVNMSDNNKDCISFYLMDSSAKDRVFIDGSYEAHIAFRVILQKKYMSTNEEVLENIDILNQLGFYLEHLDKMQIKEYNIYQIEQTSIARPSNQVQDGTRFVSAEYSIKYKKQ